MFPIRDNLVSREVPVVTWTLVGLNVLIYLWDRNWNLFGESVVFLDLAMQPAAIMNALSGRGNPYELITLFTSLFLHGNLLHLIGNMLFLIAFGNTVEHALGHWRYTLYYIFWGLVASAAHIFVHLNSLIPTVGASGAIGGVLGCYFLLFPGSRVTFIIFPLVFLQLMLPAWFLLGFWFLMQILLPQEGVANWAHAGGFMAGMLTVLIVGGREKILRGTRFVVEREDV